MFSKIDFRKIFDKVDWPFLLECLQRFGMSENFISLVQLLFTRLIVAISINKESTDGFSIRSRIAPLPPISLLQKY